MIADFTVTIEAIDGGRERAVRVVVHDSVPALRSAATRYSNKHMGNWRKRFDGDFSETLGICHRFHMADTPVCAIVRLAPPNLGVGLISHELAHAAVWIHEIEDQFRGTPLGNDNDERFCWILGELVRHTVDRLYDAGVYAKRARVVDPSFA